MSLMSIVPTFFPRKMFDMDLWSRPRTLGLSTLDLFDPFDELDRLMSKNILWVNHPELMTDLLSIAPRVPEKYRITINCGDYDASMIKTNVEGGRLTVTFNKGNGSKTFETVYDLPAYVDDKKLVSFITNGMMVIEFPVKEEEEEVKGIEKKCLFPTIVEKAGTRNVIFDVNIPDYVDPNKISVTCKDRDVIIRADYKVQKPDGFSKIHWLKRSTFPENTDFDSLKCSADSNKLTLTAPLNLKYKKHVPIEYKKN